VSRIIAAFFVSMGLVWGVAAQAQTRCPMGAQAGSIQCIPDDAPGGGGQAAPRPTGYWVKTWGAIAKSGSTGEAGNALGKRSEGEARKNAVRVCAQGGAADCEVRLTFYNQCATVVSSPSHGTIFQSSSSTERAIDLAKSSCEKDGGQCTVIWSGCTEPIFEKY